MKLVIDIGNTKAKAAVFQGKKMVSLMQASKLTTVLLKKFVSGKKIDAAILSSVAQQDKALIRYLKSFPFFHQPGPGTKLPIRNKYKTPETLGKDRLANAIGASLLFPGQHKLIIDAGTCIKYDFISSDKVYSGGAISPGLQMRYDALHHFTAKLPQLKINRGAPLIGRSTKESITSGVQNAVVAEVEGMISLYREFYQNINVILTGGEYRFFANHLKRPFFAAPHLTLSGLNEMLDFLPRKK